MNKQSRLQRIIAPLALGIGLALGVSAPAISHEYHSNSAGDYHRSVFKDVQPFRSLNVTPRYHTPLPASRYRHNYYNREYNRGNHRQRRVYRRGIRKPISNTENRNYRHNSDGYIRIRIR